MLNGKDHELLISTRTLLAIIAVETFTQLVTAA